MTDTIEIEVSEIRRSDEAILVNLYGRLQWIPISVITNERRNNGILTLEIYDWFAEKHDI